MDASEAKRPPISALRLTGLLLLSGLICGVIIGAAYASLLLFAMVEGVGKPITAGVAAILLMKVEQSTVSALSGWSPAARLLVLAALPATAVAFALRGLFGWSSWPGLLFAVAGGLVIQGVALHYLAVAVARKAPQSVTAA